MGADVPAGVKLLKILRTNMQHGMVQAWVAQKLINVTFYEFFKRPHKSQKWIYKIKLLQIVQIINSNCCVILSEIRLFYLAVTFNVVNNIYCFKLSNKC